MRGWMWVQGKPFIDTVVHHGSLLALEGYWWKPHVALAYYSLLTIFIQDVTGTGIIDVKEAAFKKLQKELIQV